MDTLTFTTMIQDTLITTDSEGGRYEVRIRVNSLPELHKAHDLVLAAFGIPIKSWRCFHCDEVFTDKDKARLHFGNDSVSGEAMCQVTAERYREVEGQLETYRIESDATSRTFFANGVEAQRMATEAEQKGYNRGIADAKAHPETLGLTRLPRTMGPPPFGLKFPRVDSPPVVAVDASPRGIVVPRGQTPLEGDLDHHFLRVFKEGMQARKSGASSPYHGHSLEHCLHGAGWVQQDLIWAVLNKLPPATHQHRKGGKYLLIGFGKMQTEQWFEVGMDDVYLAPKNFTVDMRKVAIYRSVEDYSLWARPIEDFAERFTVLS